MQLSPKRLGVVLLCLGIVVLFLMSGNEPEPEPEAPLNDPQAGGIQVKLPKTPQKDWVAEAQGIYILETDKAHLSLELQEGSRFVFISRVGDRDPRHATGTWSLVGSRLTLAYREVNGKVLEDGPDVAVNVFRGTTIQLKDTGLPEDVVLSKRTMIRGR